MLLTKETNLYQADAIANGIANGASTAVNNYDQNVLNQMYIFNKLTNNGQAQGIYLQNGKLYLNFEYAVGQTLKLGGVNNANGLLEVYNASGTKIGYWDKTGINISNGNINLGDGNFVVNTSGNMTAKGGTISQFTFDTSALIYNSGGLAGEYDRSYKDRIYIGGNTGIAISHGNNEHSIALHNGEITFGTLNIPGIIFRNQDITNRWWYTFEAYDYNRDYAWLSYSSTGYFSLDFTSQIFSIKDQYDDKVWFKFDNSNILSIDVYAVKFTVGNGGALINNKAIQTASTSSIRYKHNVELLHDNNLDPHRLYSLKAKQFRYNVDVPLQYSDMYGQTLPGFIAEDVAEIYPSAVIHHWEHSDNIESWDERRIIPPMLSLIQEQHEQIEQLMARVIELERKVS